MCLRRIRGAAEAAHVAQPFAHQITATERRRFFVQQEKKNRFQDAPQVTKDLTVFLSSMIKFDDNREMNSV